MCHLWFNTFFVREYEECTSPDVLQGQCHGDSDQATTPHKVMSPVSPPADLVMSPNCSERSRSHCGSFSSGWQQMTEHLSFQCNGKQRLPASSASSLLTPCWAGSSDDGHFLSEASYSSGSTVLPHHHSLSSHNASTVRLTNLVAPGIALAASSPSSPGHTCHHGGNNGISSPLQLGCSDHKTAASSASDSALGSTLTTVSSTDSQASSLLAGLLDTNCKTSRRLVLVLKKSELDKAHKDKQHKIFGDHFQVRVKTINKVINVD